MDSHEEDYVGSVLQCTSWAAPDAFFDALLVDKLAKGGWGQIYLGRVQSGPAEGQFVAVKVLTTGATFTLSQLDAALYRIFNAEASCLVGMSECPSVSQLLATAEVAKYGFTRYCLVMEWMSCGDAQQLVDRLGCGLSADGAGVVMLPVLQTLAHAHDIGYMHRDVKASNILLGSQGQVQLADWGICGVVPGFDDGLLTSSVPGSPKLLEGGDASSHGTDTAAEAAASGAGSERSPRVVGGGSKGSPAVVKRIQSPRLRDPPSPADGGTAATGCAPKNKSGGAVDGARGAPLGTPFWAAPELDAGDAHNESVDVWSFAVTYVELVTGRQPYYDTSPEGLARLCEPEVGYLPAGLPGDVVEWLRACLVPDSAHRPSAHQLLACPFFARIAEAAQVADAQRQGSEGTGPSDGGAAAARQLPPREAAAADAVTFALRPPWLHFDRLAALPAHGGLCGGSGRSSNDSWDGLPASAHAGVYSGSMVESGSANASPSGACSSGSPAHVRSQSLDGHGNPSNCGHDREYPQFDPDVVEEMRRLQLLPPAQ